MPRSRGIIVVNAEGVLTSVSPLCAKFFSSGDRLLDAFDPAYSETLQQEVHAAVQGSAHPREPFLATLRGGKTVRLCASVVYLAGGLKAACFLVEDRTLKKGLLRVSERGVVESAQNTLELIGVEPEQLEGTTSSEAMALAQESPQDTHVRRRSTGDISITRIQGGTRLEVVVVLDSEGVVVHCAPLVQLMLGYSAEEMIGHRIGKGAVRPESGLQIVGIKHKMGYRVFCTATVSLIEGDSKFHVVLRRAAPSNSSTFSDSEDSERSDEQVDVEPILAGSYTFARSTGKRGLNGDIFVYRHKLTNKMVAVKTIPRALNERLGIKFPPVEADVFDVIAVHPHVIACFDIIRHPDVTVLVMEFASGGDLLDYILQHERGLAENEARNLFSQILSGVSYLHSKGIAHRDIKLENCLLDSRGRVKLIDFGLAGFFRSPTGQEALLTDFCGTPGYAAPEVYHGVPYSGPAVDVWSMGVLLFTMVTGLCPFPSSEATTLVRWAWPEGFSASAALRELMDRIFQLPDQRIHMEHLQRHVWLRLDRRGSVEVSEREVRVSNKVLQMVSELGVFDQGMLTKEAVRAALNGNDRNPLNVTYRILYIKELRRALARNLALVKPDRKREELESSSESVEGKSPRKHRNNCAIF